MAYRVFCIVGVLFLFTYSAVSQYGPAAAVSNGLTTADSKPASLATQLLVKKQVSEVSLVLSVTDKKGHFIRDLSPERFSIFDNNTRQTEITFFQHQTDLPLDIAIVLDTSESVTARYDAERNSIAEFIHQIFRHEDSVTLFAFNDAIRAIAPVRYNWRDVSHRLKRLKPQGETALYDAISTAAEQLRENMRPARRIVIVVSDGQENRSKASLDSALASVLKAEAVVYSINDGDDTTTEMGKQGEEVLKTLAQSTGGNYFYASEDGDIGSAFSKIRKELRSQYVLAYKPSQISASQFHPLKVLVGNLIVRCRRGYYVK